MKLLCLCSALDIKYRFGCTPNWWQFLKGLHELGHDVIAVPYIGPAMETPWWRSYPNPCQTEAQAFYKAKSLLGDKATSTQEGFSGLVNRTLIENWIRPRWEHHIGHILGTERDVDAVILFTIPLNHLTGVPDRVRSRFNVPVFYFDGDVPASLPRFGGFASGFKIYENADLSEYDGFMCNSEGGAEDLREMGAKRVQPIHWGVDPALYEPLAMEEDRDVFFYGFGIEYREDWFEAMLAEPSRQMTDKVFAVGGKGFPPDIGRVQRVGDVPFNVFRQACCRSKINLSITRQAHGSVFASSTLRPFELAAMGRCMVSAPYKGLETWFEPDKDVVLVETAGEVLQVYERLLNDDAARKSMGANARQTVLERHTHRQRAQDIVDFVSGV